MPHANNFVAQFWCALSDILAEEYRNRFKKLYEHAAQLSEGRPREAADEVRNAFDHVATAVHCVEDFERAIQDGAAADDLSQLKEKAWVNLDQAKRHLVMGSLFCLLTQIDVQVSLIQQMARTSHLESLTAEDADALQQEADSLEARFSSARKLEVVLTSARADIREEIDKANLKIAESLDLLNDFMRLYEKLRENDGGRHQGTHIGTAR